MPADTPPVAPLPIAVELYRQLRDSTAKASTADVSSRMFDDMCIALIDSRIREHQRGLVEALLVAVDHMHADRGIDDTASQEAIDRLNAAMEIVNAALRAAGVE